MKKQQKLPVLRIVCVLLIVSFFLGWVSISYSGVSASASAFDIVFGGAGMLSAGFGGIAKLVLMLVPLSAGCILYYHIKKNSEYPVSRKLLFAIPAIACVIFFIACTLKVSEISNVTMGIGYNISVMDVLGSGFWLCLLVSGVLVFLAGSKEAEAVNIKQAGSNEPLPGEVRS